MQKLFINESLLDRLSELRVKRRNQKESRGGGVLNIC